MEKFDIDYIKEFIKAHKDAKIYLACDSQRIKKKRVKFATVVVVHYNGNNGAKVFADITYNKVIDAKLSRPFNRMMMEVQMVTEIYSQLEDVLLDRDFQIHIDISNEPHHGSNVAYNAAKGMIWGMVGVDPICKPDAFAASTVADKWSK